ncbi:hypothetical protein QIW31_08665 [Francisellaceae bacterium CB299]|jgi:hypothetical protein
MKTKIFEKLYTDFKSLFDICRYSDDALKEEILKRVTDDNITSGSFFFRFSLVIFKFEVSEGCIEYIGYEK